MRVQNLRYPNAALSFVRRASQANEPAKSGGGETCPAGSETRASELINQAIASLDSAIALLDTGIAAGTLLETKIGIRSALDDIAVELMLQWEHYDEWDREHL